MESGERYSPDPPELGPAGCLVVIACYDDLERVIEPLVADDVALLGDFAEQRFASLGPRPADESGLAAGTARAAAALTRPAEGADRHFFGLLLIDGPPAALPLRCRTLAAAEDRDDSRVPCRRAAGPAGSGGEPVLRQCVLVSPSGGWRRRELVDEIRGYADELMRDFMFAAEPGLTAEDVRGPAGTCARRTARAGGCRRRSA
jgi:hypothetical protein